MATGNIIDGNINCHKFYSQIVHDDISAREFYFTYGLIASSRILILNLEGPDRLVKYFFTIIDTGVDWYRTTIISDGWAAYMNISSIPGYRYTHRSVNHS
ncbi:hypothetical protein HZS_7302 [Henneguya salminicola]|nr:hypothetical protein HZS_7302 [Henneguya salminicola]